LLMQFFYELFGWTTITTILNSPPTYRRCK
jgi:hypothetical protein